MRKKVVIVGAGFAGLQVAKRLRHSGYETTLIDQYNFHQFQPLFYQVATARLEPSAISFPLRKVFQNEGHVHVRIANVRQVDVNKKQVATDRGIFGYDHLVIATGCRSNFFGNNNFEQYAFPMKSVNDAIALRNRILLNFEDALNAAPDELEEIMNIVVVGGGPTGVELAGSLAEMKKFVLPKDYPDMDFSRLNIFLVEGMAHTLQQMSTSSQQASQEYLDKMGVHIILNVQVKDFDGRVLILSDGRQIKTRNMIWTAGITGNAPSGLPADVFVKGNRIKVDLYNRVEGFDDVYAIGDIAYMETKDFPKGHPQLANVAINQAKNLASNLKSLLKQGPLKGFIYKNPGTMATVGKHKAVVDLPSFSFQGRLAWFTWMFLHLMLILSVRNKLLIFFNWAISYVTNDTTLRLILLPTRKQVEMGEKEAGSSRD